MHLEDFGFDERVARHLSQNENLLTGRVISVTRAGFVVATEAGELAATLPARSRREGVFCVVGDWIELERADATSGVVRNVLPRTNLLSRATAGEETTEQPLAANVDHAAVVTSLDRDLNPRRIERYVTVIWEGGSLPLVVLTKADLCDALDDALELVAAAAPGVDVVVTTTRDPATFEDLRPYLLPNKTLALFGSSGVGKSTLVAALTGRQLAAQETRWDGKGRHTTTARHLIPATGGGVVLDSPGMRELGLWGTEGGVADAFPEITALAAACRFRDCAHESEPGCAVTTALVSGELDPARLHSFRKLQRELRALARKKDRRLAAEEARKWRLMGQEAKARARQR